MSQQEHALGMGETVTMGTEQPPHEDGGSSAENHAMRSLPHGLSRDTGEGLLPMEAVLLGNSHLFFLFLFLFLPFFFFQPVFSKR